MIDATKNNAVPHITTADILLIASMTLPERSRRPAVLPAAAKLANQIQDTTKQEPANTSFSIPAYASELVPITPIVSKIACGFSSDTEAAKAICFLAVNVSPFSLAEAGFVFHVTYPIYARNATPTLISATSTQWIPNTSTETP